jgi:DNA-cytosine methyltransferase
MEKLTILSIFDGISACQVALKNLGIEYDYYASEIDPYAIKVTQANFPDTVQLGDVRGIEYCSEGEYGDRLYYNKPLKNHNIYGTSDIKIEEYYEEGEEGFDFLPLKFDLLCGGSPCQDLSIAKKDRKGLGGERSALFYEYVRILNEVKPKFFILENVASMSKESKNAITKELFDIEPILINSALVSAQQRKRFFWVGALQEDGTYKKIEIEQPQDKNKTVWEILELEPNIKVENFDDFTRISEDRVNGRLGFYKTTKRLGHFNSGGQGDRVYSRFGKSVCLSANGGGRGAKCGLYLTKYNEIRKLTPIECERLQGFPDGFTSEISSTRRYQCLGNSFTVPVIEHILKTILK